LRLTCPWWNCLRRCAPLRCSCAGWQRVRRTRLLRSWSTSM
jgi:hypothetical protein